MAGRKRKSDVGLILALACGASPESAAQKTGVSLRTIYRRIKEPGFQEQVSSVRTDMVRRAAGLLTAAGLGAIKTFSVLQESAKSEAVRLGAARAVVEFGHKLREALDLEERLTALERRAAEPESSGGEDR